MKAGRSKSKERKQVKSSLLRDGLAVSDEGFSPLVLVKFYRPLIKKNQYRIYATERKSVTVDAATVIEALKQCNIRSPLRIVPVYSRLSGVLRKTELVREVGLNERGKEKGGIIRKKRNTRS